MQMISSPRTLPGLLNAATQQRSGAPFLIVDDLEITYDVFEEKSLQVARGLKALGVHTHDRVCLLMGNRPEFLYTFWGCAQLGAVVVPVNPALTSTEVRYILEDSGSVALITTAALARRHARMPTPEIRVCTDNAPDGYLPFDIFWSEVVDALMGVSVTGAQQMSIIYTSGTTGKPKGVRLTHANYLYDSEAYATACQATEEDRFLCMLPLFHVNAQVASMLCAMQRGAVMILLEGFSASTFLEDVARTGATSFSGVPTVYAILNNLPDATDYDLSALRVCICGAAPMPVEVFERFESTFNAFILEGYGLSEGTCVSTLNPLDGRPRKVGTVGVALPGQRVRVVDNQGVPAEVGEVGEVVIQGPNVMMGYHNRPAATGEALRDGWLHTGDLGTLDADGYLTIVGRKKEMIIRGGENIYPTEVEEVLYRHPDVVEAAVVGLPDEVWGEEVAAFLVLREGALSTGPEVMEFCRDSLAAYKLPRAVHIWPELPKTATGKIRKAEIVARYEQTQRRAEAQHR